MLEKLENLYLAILRFVVIVVAGLLLVAVGVLGINYFRTAQEAPPEKKPINTVSVSDSDLKRAVILEAAATEAHSSGASKSPSSADSANASNPDAQRATAAISKFIASTVADGRTVNERKLTELIMNKVEHHRKKQAGEAYAKAFADGMERLTLDPEVIAAAKGEDAFAVLRKLWDTFDERFDASIADAEAAQAAKEVEFVARKAQGQQGLYGAGAAFVAFLLIVFLSIIIKIERNLRNLKVTGA